MTDDFPTPEEIINGTYRPKPVDRPADGPTPASPVLRPVDEQHTAKLKKLEPLLPPDKISIYVPQGMTMDEEQKKALSIIMSGLPFVIVAMRPTFSVREDPTLATGADFITALCGDKGILLDAGPHLPGVLERLYERKGIV